MMVLSYVLVVVLIVLGYFTPIMLLWRWPSPPS